MPLRNNCDHNECLHPFSKLQYQHSTMGKSMSCIANYSKNVESTSLTVYLTMETKMKKISAFDVFYVLAS